MLTILHGDDIASSRSEFLKAKQNATDPISLRAGEFIITDLMQICEGGSLFSESKNLFVEDLFLRIKKGSELTTYTDYLSRQSQSHSIFIWEGKVLTKQQLTEVAEAKIVLFKLPTILFTFLDELSPHNTTKLLRLAQKVKADIGPEMLFAMLIRQIRILLAISELTQIDEVKKLAPWQQTKLKKQSSLFTNKQLLTLHEKLFVIDKARKTGNNPVPLEDSIDFFLAFALP